MLGNSTKLIKTLNKNINKKTIYNLKSVYKTSNKVLNDFYNKSFTTEYLLNLNNNRRYYTPINFVLRNRKL
jgi:hypothetical protein